MGSLLVVLSAVVLAGTASGHPWGGGGGFPLIPQFYDHSCPHAMDIVRSIVGGGGGRGERRGATPSGPSGHRPPPGRPAWRRPCSGYTSTTASSRCACKRLIEIPLVSFNITWHGRVRVNRVDILAQHTCSSCSDMYREVLKFLAKKVSSSGKNQQLKCDFRFWLYVCVGSTEESAAVFFYFPFSTLPTMRWSTCIAPLYMSCVTHKSVL
jgi:hypothetical protein